MPKASPISVLTCGLLLASAAFADDESEPLETAAADEYSFDLPTTYSDYDLAAPIDNIEFLDNSALARIQRLEDFSFLTLAETPGSRLFIGVNRDGLVGLHFRMR